MKHVLIDDETGEVTEAYDPVAGEGIRIVHLVPGSSHKIIPEQPKHIWKELVEHPRRFKLDKVKGVLKKG